MTISPAIRLPAPARRLTTLPPYPFALISQRVIEMTAGGIDVIRLDIGSPDLPPPAPVIDALTESVHNPGHHGYAGYKGTKSFRHAIAAYYARRFGVTVDPETQVLPLLGSKEGIVNLSLAYLDAGDLALVPEIGYPAYSLGAHLAGAETHWLPLSADYLPDLNAIPPAALERAKLLWVNYPNNPTGATADLAFYERTAAFCARHHLLLASDNPYVDLTFDGYVAPSALQVAGALDCTVEFISFSKTYNMAGWRLGAAVGAAEAIRALLTVKSNVDSGHFKAIYDAGEAAIDTPQSWIDSRNAVYQRRRDRIMATLPHIGLTGETPQGSLYIWARVHDGDSARYAERALTEAHVCLAPGGIYGPGGTDYVRFSLGIDDAALDEAVRRLESWYARQETR